MSNNRPWDNTRDKQDRKISSFEPKKNTEAVALDLGDGTLGNYPILQKRQFVQDSKDRNSKVAHDHAEKAAHKENLSSEIVCEDQGVQGSLLVSTPDENSDQQA
jgi:hypothetical protein